ncbi:sporulation histidine kinase inhibitor Sda [Bacillus salitolerans]|uniref:Sporulation histidine kinase inhibitor Sda n=1 Tax=Bacillus salitolerans TaxID=1437434 RepID=A0ABW4LWD4_9BACI
MNIPDEELIEAYIQAIKLDLDLDFIAMLSEEFEARNLKINNYPFW